MTLKHSNRWRTAVGLVVAGIFLVFAPTTDACPNCPQGMRSFAEHIASSDAVVLAEWVQGIVGQDNHPGSTTVRIRQLIKSQGQLKPGKPLRLNEFRSGKPGDLLLLFAIVDEDLPGLVWNNIIDLNPTRLKYILKVPPKEVISGKRLMYFLDHLESNDELIANDAFAEFANSEYQDLLSLAPKFPKEKLRSWVGGTETQEVRLGLYATMLGLCGNADDAKLLESRMSRRKAVGAYQLGMEGMISGYLMIQGEKGLDVIDSKFLRNKSAEFSDTFAAAQGLRFMWTYSPQISQERLCQSMEFLLDRPEMADLVIADLARWKDWSVQDRLFKLYGKKDYDTVAIKRAIARFLIACSTQPSAKGPPSTMNTRQIRLAREHLAELRKIDPKIVSDAERFFLVP